MLEVEEKRLERDQKIEDTKFVEEAMKPLENEKDKLRILVQSLAPEKLKLL